MVAVVELDIWKHWWQHHCYEKWYYIFLKSIRTVFKKLDYDIKKWTDFWKQEIWNRNFCYEIQKIVDMKIRIIKHLVIS